MPTGRYECGRREREGAEITEIEGGSPFPPMVKYLLAAAPPSEHDREKFYTISCQ
jgi:hypothetical protein